MVVEYVRYVIPNGRESAFEEAYTNAQRSLKDAPQCLGYELSRCQEEPGRYILRIEWTSTDDHIKGFRGGPHFGAFLAAVRPFIDNIEEMQHYQLTAITSQSS